MTGIDGTKITLSLGEISESEQGGGQGGTPPEMPSGDNSSEQNGQPPEKPDNDANGTQNAAPQGGQGGNIVFTESGESLTVDLKNAEITKDSQSIDVSDLAEGDYLTVTYGSKNTAEKAEVYTSSGSAPAGGGQGFGGSTAVTQGDSANTLTEDGSFSGSTYLSSGDDENALRIDGATVTLDGITVEKSAGASSDTENGVFSYGNGTTVNISDSKITTSADNSGGIQTIGGATTNATNLTVKTSGNSSAAIRSDRGGGTVNVDSGSYESNGYNSPAVYSTANITVKNASLTANNSEAVVVEGKNSVTLENCTVYGNMSDTKGSSSDENVHNVMIYQSMSGDADVGTSSFTMTGGSLESNNGDMFYITNTTCNLTLSGVTLKNNDTSGRLLVVSGNSASKGWGTAGQNGAQVTFKAENQTLSGVIEVDSISTLDMTLSAGSVFTGMINITENAQGGSAVSNNAVVTVESGAVWNLTGDCTLTSLTNNGTINFNGHTVTLADGTVLSA